LSNELTVFIKILLKEVDRLKTEGGRKKQDVHLQLFNALQIAAAGSGAITSGSPLILSLLQSSAFGLYSNLS
jgi:hypothetical protein